MKKNTIKAFTLVEMLIVIVIIGILIAALLPRMQAAQWRARDVARKTALSQVQSAIVTYQWDHGKWPKQDDSTSGVSLNTIESELLQAWMTEMPKDPLADTDVSWLWASTWKNYLYMVATRNWSPKWWFALMAKTEVAWWSNWVRCASTAGNNVVDTAGNISATVDLKDIHPCPNVEETGGNCSNPNNGTGTCYYKDIKDLRYIVLY